jgi:hypothetical protein
LGQLRANEGHPAKHGVRRVTPIPHRG